MTEQVASLILYSMFGFFMFVVGFAVASWCEMLKRARRNEIELFEPDAPLDEEIFDDESTTTQDILDARSLREDTLSRAEKVNAAMDDYLAGRVPFRPVEPEVHHAR